MMEEYPPPPILEMPDAPPPRPRVVRPVVVPAAWTPNTSQAGVVIGSYKWPFLIELQILTIRESCGPVPICISDDDPANTITNANICAKYPDVYHWPNGGRIGHTGGDIAAFWKGVVWGKARGLRTVVKLSQRFLLTIPRWLQTVDEDLYASGLSTAGQRIEQYNTQFPFRTEAVALAIDHWHTPEKLRSIAPGQYWNRKPTGYVAEDHIFQAIPGNIYWPWAIMSPDRRIPVPGVIWHESNKLVDYVALARRYGLTPEKGFHTDGWQRDLLKGEYSYG